MTTKDQLKLMSAGFRIIRADMFRLLIKFKTGQGEWRTLEKGFKTKKALENRMRELLICTKTIED